MDNAIEYGKKAIKYFDKGSTDLAQNCMANIRTRLGWAYYHKGNFAEAKNNFNTVSYSGTKSNNFAQQEALRGLGWCHFKEKQYYNAISKFTQALEIIEPKNKSALQDGLLGRGWSNLCWGEYSLALKDFNQALENRFFRQ